MPNDEFRDVASDAFRDVAMTVIYGVDTCEDTTRARARFDAAGRAFRYVRLDVDTATRQRLHDLGLVSTPVLVTPAGTVSVEPSDDELDVIIAATA
ncbi:MAG: glutaredoxin domain-containing protein [Chloroflexota bacterium]